MTEPLPQLSDDEKRALCERLEGWGLVRRDEQGRFRITQDGNVAGCMLYAMAIFEEAECATVWPPGSRSRPQ
jgi:hypothetical protein